MTNKTMPERIWLTELFGETKWRQRKQKREDVEYVRADLAAGDSNEPLADGQLRWVKSRGEPRWQTAFILLGGSEEFYFYVHGSGVPMLGECDIAEIGPAIRPPEGV